MSRARDIWQAGVDAVVGDAAVRQALRDDPRRPDRILAVGKAAGAMARAALDIYSDVPTLVVTKDGHGEGLPEGIELIEASHPVPDRRSLEAGKALKMAVCEMGAGTDLLLLVSGGASALAEDLEAGFSLADLARLNDRLLAAGMDITAMNVERRKLSRIKGGGLLRGFRGARVRVLAISDVPGDDLAVIGSGIGDLPKDRDFEASARIIASNAHARAAATQAARDAGLKVHLNEEALHADLAELAATWGPRLRDMAPGVIILGGEPTVHLPENPGRGGRNQALALALAEQIAGVGELSILVGGTDGSDGPTGAAGAEVDGTTWRDDAAAFLAAADSGSYLDSCGALVVTGPTGTNVMDLLVAVRE